VMPFLEIARNEGSVHDYLFECRCHSRPMRQSIAWLALAFSIEPKQLHSVKQKHIKPCDSSLKSAKVYRALDEGILVCFQHESGDGEEDHPTRRWVAYILIIFSLHFHFCTLHVQCQVFPLRPTIVKEVGDEFVSYFRFCLTLKASVLLTPFCHIVGSRKYPHRS